MIYLLRRWQVKGSMGPQRSENCIIQYWYSKYKPQILGNISENDPLRQSQAREFSDVKTLWSHSRHHYERYWSVWSVAVVTLCSMSSSQNRKSELVGQLGQWFIHHHTHCLTYPHTQPPQIKNAYFSSERAKSVIVIVARTAQSDGQNLNQSFYFQLPPAPAQLLYSQVSPVSSLE